MSLILLDKDNSCIHDLEGHPRQAGHTVLPRQEDPPPPPQCELGLHAWMCKNRFQKEIWPKK
jgi:hypothetical protein